MNDDARGYSPPPPAGSAPTPGFRQTQFDSQTAEEMLREAAGRERPQNVKPTGKYARLRAATYLSALFAVGATMWIHPLAGILGLAPVILGHIYSRAAKRNNYSKMGPVMTLILGYLCLTSAMSGLLSVGISQLLGP